LENERDLQKKMLNKRCKLKSLSPSIPPVEMTIAKIVLLSILKLEHEGFLFGKQNQGLLIAI